MPIEAFLKDVKAVKYYFGMKVDAPIGAKSAVKVYDRMLPERKEKTNVSATKKLSHSKKN